MLLLCDGLINNFPYGAGSVFNLPEQLHDLEVEQNEKIDLPSMAHICIQ